MEKGNTVYSFTYDPAGRPVSISDGNTRYYYVLNQQGDVVGLMNGNKKLVVEYIYDAWGRLISTTGTLATTLGTNNPLRYRGYVYDTETGLYYLQSRYYNPEMGRFINADSQLTTRSVTGLNLFAYCNNNPVNIHDDNGMHSGSYAGAVGEGSGIFLYELIIGVDYPFGQVQQIGHDAIETQIDMFVAGVAVARGAGHSINSQIQGTELILERTKAAYHYLDETGIISGVKYGYHTIQAAREGRKALAYLTAPIPSPIDEFFAVGHAIKGIYHLLRAGMEVFQ